MLCQLTQGRGELPLTAGVLWLELLAHFTAQGFWFRSLAGLEISFLWTEYAERRALGWLEPGAMGGHRERERALTPSTPEGLEIDR